MIITISGVHGVGKSTIGKKISEKLGLKYYSTGQAFRDLAEDMHMTLEEFTKYVENHPEIDNILDQKVIDIVKQGNIIIDSQLSGYLLEHVADFKILLTCSLETRVRRMVERDQATHEKKVKETSLRENSELERFKNLYRIDLNNMERNTKVYDLIIDTENLSIEEVLDKILSSIKNIS